MNVVAFLILICWSIWLGSIVFFSFVVAPSVFRVLGREGAAPVMRALFPHYYMVGIACGGIAITLALVSSAGPLLTVPLVICTVLVAYARQAITPAVNEARENDDAERFASLHVLSVRLNMIVLALLLLAGTVLLGPPS